MNHKTLILGSGFGLYGYLPAVLSDASQTAVLAKKSREKLLARPELEGFAPRVEWAGETEMQVCGATRWVVCLPPNEQAKLQIPSSVDELVLEKPLAPTPNEARQLLAGLAANCRWRVGYTLLFTKWYAKLCQALQLRQAAGAQSCPVHIKINWQFMAHHLRHKTASWKANAGDGGGVLRFYGIHLIALAADLGCVQVATNQLVRSANTDDGLWRVALGSARSGVVHSVEWTLNSCAQATVFRVEAVDAQGNVLLIQHGSDPFQDRSDGSLCGQAPQDLRVEPLKKLLHLSGADLIKHQQTVRSSIELWHKLELNLGSDCCTDQTLI